MTFRRDESTSIQQRLIAVGGEARVAPPLRRPKKRLHKRSRGNTRTTSKRPAQRTKRSRRPPARRPLLPAWADLHKDVDDPHNDRCEECDLGGSLVCCYSCGCVWHRKCHDRLRNKRNVDDSWQCDECLEEEDELSGGTRAAPSAWSAAGTGAGTSAASQTTDNEANAAWEEWQQDVHNDEDSDHAEDLDSNDSAATTAPARMSNTRSAPKQKVRIATFFNKQVQLHNKRKRPLTLEEIIGDSSEDEDDDSDNNAKHEQNQQRSHPREMTGNHRKMKKKRRKKSG